MHVYVQKSTSTTFPRRSAGVSGAELSQPVAPSNAARRPSRGKGTASPEWRVRNKLMDVARLQQTSWKLVAEGSHAPSRARPTYRTSVRPSFGAWMRRRLAARGGLGPQRQDPIRADEVARVAVGVALEVILVLGLGFPEVAGRRE